MNIKIPMFSVLLCLGRRVFEIIVCFVPTFGISEKYSKALRIMFHHSTYI